MVAGATMAPPAGATQMGVSVTCPICRTNNSGMEAYCGECGFLLTSAPGPEATEPEQAAGPAVELVENTSGRRFKLKAGPNIVGRENCDILLMEGTVSRRHAQVVLEDGRVTVTDLGSTNGTEVDGGRLTPNMPAPLSPGGMVKFGNATLTFSAGAEASAAAPSAPADVTVVVGAAPAAIADQTLVGAPDAASAEAAQVPEEERAPVEPVEAQPQPGAIGYLRPASTSGAEIAVRSGTFTIGRRAGNDIVIATDPYISGAHAMIQCDDNGVSITDVGSTNGTTVNGVRLQPNARQLLVDGDEVTFGQTSYRFEVAAPREEESPADGSLETADPDDLATEGHSGQGPDEVAG
jgi:pSer/pThr/pTyr-binding forkhead associated (FHA) protein